MREPIVGKRADSTSISLLKPGEYTKFDGAWFSRDPWDDETWPPRLSGLAKHDVVEHEDGTITVSPSILQQGGYRLDGTKKDDWHGYLERGVWRSC